MSTTFLYFTMTFYAYAQNNTDVSELKVRLGGAKTIANKIEILNLLAIVYSKADSSNTFLYANQAIELANKIHDISGKANAYHAKAQYFFLKNNGDASLTLYQKEAELQRQANKKEAFAAALTGIGKSYILLTKYQAAIPYVEQAIDIYKEVKHNGGLISNYNQLGIIYNAIGKKDVAISNFLSSLKIVSNLPDQPGYVSLHINIGRLYWEIGQFEQSKTYFLNAIQKSGEIKDDLNKGKAMLNLGNIYVEQKKYEDAINYIKNAIPIFERIGLKAGLVSCYNNLGAIKIRQGNYGESIPFLKKALEYIDHKNDKPGLVLTQQNIAYAYTMLSNFTEAEKWFSEAEMEAEKGATPYVKSELYNHMAILDSLKGDYQSAFHHRNKYHTLASKQLNEKISRQINELQIKYDTEKKEGQIVLLNKENSIKSLDLLNRQLQLDKSNAFIKQQDQQLTIKQLELTNKNQLLANQQLDAEKKTQNIKALEKQSRIQKLELQNKNLEVKQRNLAIGSLLMAFIAVGAISFSYYKRSKLKQQNLLQAEIYKQQEVATRSVFEGEQNERIRIARDLHDGIGQMLSVVKMNVSTLNPDDKTVENTLNLVDKTIDELRSISHNLIPEALNFGLYAALEDICEKINDAGKTQVSIRIAENVQHIELAQQNKLSVYRIVQEVLNNMVKHANASQINVDITKGEANMLIAIRDNGVGFDTAKIGDAKGIGWKNISARVHLLDGDMNIKSEKLLGTQIEISIPA